MKNLTLLGIVLSSLYLAGCTHPLEVRNAEQYFLPPSPPLAKAVRLGVTSSNLADAQNSRYVNAIIDGLQRTGNFEKLIYPYSQAVHQGQADVLVDISVNPSYKGRGSNFFINWPGFLIFAPAIWGYGYNADIETKVSITKLKENASNQITIPTNFEFRHAAMNRTWTEVGWLEVSLIPLIGGFVFTDYDANATDEFITKVSPNYGAYVAKKISEAL